MKQDKKTIITLAVSVSAVLVLVIFIIYPLFSEIKKSSAEYLDQKSKLAGLEDKNKNLQQFQAAYQDYEPDLEKINALFIDLTEPVNFIEFLEKEALQSQLFIEIAPLASEKVKGDNWPSMNFQLVLNGSFPGFLQFFEKLESSPYLVEIVSLNMRRLNDWDVRADKFKSFSVGDINASFLIKAYAQTNTQ